MSHDAFKKKLLLAEEQRLSKVPTISLENVYKFLMKKIGNRS
ncbi:hypothetical protein ACFQ1X_15105 [Metaplanococcus flavidus]|uniref:Uncharacterized protein n=1 Tax=Metaplanococcus flavidus TaxID=569883 RepID=A0ABW3LGG0_9BACL